MKSIKIFILASAIAMTAFAAAAFIGPKPVKPTAVAVKGFAVIELFTSEGCSSCPPADALVSKIQKEYKDQPVYILAYHVDYWNRLGWRDAFSDAAYSARQNDYARYLLLKQIYTPQIVVNGKQEFVGSEEGTLRNAIKIWLQKPTSTQVTLSDIKVDNNKATLHYQAEGTGSSAALLLALVEKHAESNVKAGENKGRNLSHVQIIRQLQTTMLNGGHDGNASIALPRDVNTQNWELIALIQNTRTGEIIGATKQALPVGS